MNRGTHIRWNGLLLITFLAGCAPNLPPPPPPAPSTTANVLEITRVTDDPIPEFYPRLSPDGTKLLFIVFDRNKSDWEGFSIVMIRKDESGRVLAAGPYAVEPAWFPDSETFVYRDRSSGKSVLVKKSSRGTGKTFFNPQPYGDDDSEPHVSPDGRKMAFSTQMGGIYYVCSVDATGGNFTIHTDGSGPKWNPDGTKLSFHRKVGNEWQCFIIDLKNGQVTQLTTMKNNLLPVWSPDGNWIAFISDRDGKPHLYIMRSDGSDVTQLTSGGSRETHPEWGIDGYIYFTSDAGAPVGTQNIPWWHTYSNIWKLKPILPDRR